MGRGLREGLYWIEWCSRRREPAVLALLRRLVFERISHHDLQVANPAERRHTTLDRSETRRTTAGSSLSSSFWSVWSIGKRAQSSAYHLEIRVRREASHRSFADARRVKHVSMPYHEHVKRRRIAFNPGQDVQLMLGFSDPTIELLDEGVVWVILDFLNPTVEPKEPAFRRLGS